jgi:hypothetical protein
MAEVETYLAQLDAAAQMEDMVGSNWLAAW